MEIHLFSTPGEVGLEYVVAAAREILAQQRKPHLAYIPAASLYRRWIRETRAAFKGLASLSAIDVEHHSYERIQAALDQANLLYLPGGNTYLMAHRLNRAYPNWPGGLSAPGSMDENCEVTGQDESAGLIDANPVSEMGGPGSLMAEIRRRVLGGLPLIGCSAGAVVCGPDILTTNDINACGCVCFTGLDLLPFHLNMHFPGEPGPDREARLDRLQEFLHFHPRQIILALENGAYLRVAQGEVHVGQGNVWQIAHRKEPVLLTE